MELCDSRSTLLYMKVIGRSRLQSSRAHLRRIDRTFEHIFQLLIICFFVFTLLSMLSKENVFRISKLNVEGADVVMSKQIEEVSSKLLAQKILYRIDRDNKILYPKSSISQAIFELDSRIREVQVTPRGLKQLDIVVSEYQPAILWCGSQSVDGQASSSDSCYLADEHGYVYAHAPAYSGHPFTIFYADIAGLDQSESPIGLYVLPEKELERVLEFYRLLLGQGVSVIEVAHTIESDYDLTTDEGWTITWSTRRDATSSVENLLAALSNIRLPQAKRATTTPRTVDLRFEDKIFYK